MLLTLIEKMKEASPIKKRSISDQRQAIEARNSVRKSRRNLDLYIRRFVLTPTLGKARQEVKKAKKNERQTKETETETEREREREREIDR
jgi:hypothetical protein